LDGAARWYVPWLLNFWPTIAGMNGVKNPRPAR